jgi:hypothetical protein
MPKKEVLEFKSVPRLEQVGDKRPKQNGSSQSSQSSQSSRRMMSRFCLGARLLVIKKGSRAAECLHSGRCFA